MDRQIIYPGQIPLETDLLNTQRNVLIALGKLAAVTVGTATVANGLTVTQTTVPSMAVTVGAGEIYATANLDATAYSSLPLDVTHQIVKQGIALDSQNLAIAAPGTAGQSVVYLIQATYQDVDATSVVLPYYNSANPAVAYSGPGGGGTSQSTQRLGKVIVSAKAGTPATTGSQVAPAPDSGYIGLYTVTVANGASSVVNANIAVYSAASFIGGAGSASSVLATGAAGAATGTISMSGYSSRPNQPKKQWAVIQCADTSGLSTQTWTFPNSTLFTTGVTAMRSQNLAILAGQSPSSTPPHPDAGNISLASQSATGITFTASNTSTVGTKFWMYIEVEGY